MRLGRALVLVVASMAVVGCGGDGEPTSSGGGSPAATADVPPTTERAPTTSSTRAAATSTRPERGFDAPIGAVLVAGPSGIALWTSGSPVDVLLADPVEGARPDLRGGIVFQRAEAGSARPVSIERRRGPGLPSDLAYSDPDARYVTLEDVVLLDGVPTMVVRVGRTLPNDCPPPPAGIECSWDHEVDHLELVDLATGGSTVLGRIGSFESSPVRYALADRRAAVVAGEYGEDSCWRVGLVNTGDLLAGAAPDRWIGSVTGIAWLPYGAATGPGGSCAAEPVARAVSADIAADGTVAVATWSSPYDPARAGEPLTVAWVDSATGAELARVALTDERPSPLFVDTDGTRAVISGGDGTPVVVGRDGTRTDVPVAGRAVLWDPGPG